MEIKIDNEKVKLIQEGLSDFDHEDDFDDWKLQYIKFYDCEDIDFKHAWEKIEEHRVHLTCPPTYPPPKRKCLNCGKVQTLVTKQHKIQEWQDS